MCAGRPALIAHRGEKLAQIRNLPQLKLVTVCYAPKLRVFGALPNLDFVLIKSCPNLRKLQDLPPISSVSVMCCRRKGLQDRLKKGSDVA